MDYSCILPIAYGTVRSVECIARESLTIAHIRAVLEYSLYYTVSTHSFYVNIYYQVGGRVTWGFGDDLSLTYLFASTSDKSYMYLTNYMLCEQ